MEEESSTNSDRNSWQEDEKMEVTEKADMKMKRPKCRPCLSFFLVVNLGENLRKITIQITDEYVIW